jgi:hypothetical protein
MMAVVMATRRPPLHHHLYHRHGVRGITITYVGVTYYLAISCHFFAPLIHPIHNAFYQKLSHFCFLKQNVGITDGIGARYVYRYPYGCRRDESYH